MTVLSQPQIVGMAANGRIPPLENGDRLTRPEFERRYSAMPQVKKAELIEGVVYKSSSVPHDHARSHLELVGWLGAYCAATSGVCGSNNGTLRLDLDNELQPDAFLRILAEHGGQARVDEDGYISGAPELVAEVSRSSVSIDLHAKRIVYRRNGVREYIVWRIEDRAIDWFALREGRYEPLAIGSDGLYRSEVLPGLWLDAAALLRGNLLAVFQTVQRGLASPEHADFVRRLQEATAQRRS